MDGSDNWAYYDGDNYADVEKISPTISATFLPIFYGYLIRLISTGIEKVKNP